MSRTTISRNTAGLLLLFLLALSLRLTAVALLQPPAGRPQTYEHGEIARNLVTGRGFSVTFLGVDGPTSQQAPWAPTLLAGAYLLTGVDSPTAVWLVQIVQCLAGACLALAVVWLTASLVPDRPWAPWIAGYGAALYPPHIYMATHIQVAPWAALVLTLLMVVVVPSRSRVSWRWAVVAGLLGGWLLLVEPILGLALPVAAITLGCRAMGDLQGKIPSFRFEISNCRFAIVAMSLMTVTTLAVVTPWLVRNYLVHGEPVFIKSTLGYAFWQGNHPLSWGTDKIPKPTVAAVRAAHDGTLAGRNAALWEARHETLYIDDVILKPQGYDRFQGLTEPQRSRLLGDEAWSYIAADSGRYFRLCLQRLRYFLLFDETNPKAADPIYRLSTLLWLGLSSLGIIVGIRYWRVWTPTLTVFALVTAFHCLTIVSARFRIPLEPLSFVWAATGVAICCQRIAAGGYVAFWQRFNFGRRCRTATLPSAA